ncbi:hypothetical protein B7C62_03840 [Kitasatospora albolonga]|uniref:Peptidase S1A alpha-lytic prodomain domain-containing protein n=3 Tax=Streptomycetaceae TaxID=2062 RepID=A0ABC8BMA0_9ACTN|nr:hypothetical protein B7C62_03840 [Kitasatospora albolonga]
MANQQKAQEIADALDTVVNKERLKGFTGLTVAPDAVTLHWKGKVPARITSVIGTATVPVNVKAAPFSLAELDAAARAVGATPPASLAGKVTRVGPTSDFAAIEVATDTAVPGTGHKAAPAESVNGIPIRYVVEARSVGASRWDDTAPFWGGNAIDRLVDPIFRTYAYCTTAFPVRRSNGSEALLTAEHCGANKKWNTPYGDRLVGNSNGGSKPLDAMLLTGSTYGNAIFVGDHNSNQGVLVGGAANPAVSSYIFASGSFSGASVLRVQSVNQYLANSEGVLVGPGFWAINEEGDASVGEGDSGGPVAGTHSNPQRVTARGLISHISTGSYLGSCVGVVHDGRLCSTRSFHVNIGAITSGLSVTVKTS